MNKRITLISLLIISFFSTCKPMKKCMTTGQDQKIKKKLLTIKNSLTSWEFHQFEELYKNRPHMATPIILKASKNEAFFGRTPLHIAIAEGRLFDTQKMIQNGADVSARNSLGQTVLHYIILSENLHVPAKCFMLNTIAKRESLELNAKDIFGATPLIYATIPNHEIIVYRLVELGADVYLPGNNGNTPLHWAAYAQNIPVCTFLINTASSDNHNYRMLQNIHGATPYNKLYEGSNNPPKPLVYLLHPQNQPLTLIQRPKCSRYITLNHS